MPSTEVTTPIDSSGLDTALAVWQAEVKDELRIKSSDANTQLTRLTHKAYFWAERESGQRLLQQTLTTLFDAHEARSPLYLPGHVIRSITSVTTYDIDDNATTVPTTDYNLDGITPAANFVLGGRLVATNGGWLRERAVNTLSVVYVVGYGTTADTIPEGITDAIVRRAATSYRHPTDDAVTVERAAVLSPVLQASSILWPYRVDQ